MSASMLSVSDKVAALVGAVSITEGGLRAETAGEVFEGDNPSAVARKLGAALYQTLHTGRDKPLAVKLRRFRDPTFDAALDEAMGHRSTTVSARQVGGGGEHAIVEIDGLRVRVPAESIVGRSDDRTTVMLPCARPGLSPGFFLATSGKVPFDGSGPLLRLYGRLDDPDAAPSVWAALVGFLEDAAIGWQAKISSTRSLYPRNDAVVIYLPRSAWRAARPCAETLQGTGLLGEGSSPFTHPVTPSVGCAFEPNDRRPSRQGMSFGQHRTQVFAEALLTHATQPDEQEPVTDSIYAAFVDAGIDPRQPARNLSSPVVDVLSSS